MAYRKKLSAVQPGCLIVLIDQSGAMAEPLEGAAGAPRRSKAEAASEAVNNALFRLIKTHIIGEAVRSRVEVAVLGYGGRAAWPARTL